jgi:transcriptional regulator with XRE-family HTH domain
VAKKQKNRSAFGQLLWEQRKQQKMTMRVLATTVGVSESYISLLESGDRQQPARELVLKLAHTLGARSSNQLADQFLLAAGYYPADKQMYEHHGDTIQGFLATLQQDPTNFQAYSALIFAHIKLGNTDEAREMIQKGLGRFENSNQLQSLLASLELAKQNFDKAIELQRFALEQQNQDQKNQDQKRKQKSPAKPTNQTLSEETRRLQLNLGIMHFLRGLHHQHLWFSQQQKPSQRQAQTDYATAKSLLKSLLNDHSDAYVMDEYARICFNQAFVGGEKEALLQTYWKECSETFEAVLRTPDKFTLGRQILVEACVFLALSYAHQSQFSMAELLIHSLEVALNPPVALVYYLKACYHSLKGAHTTEAQEAEYALDALRTVHRIDPNFTSQALEDPDLAWLRHHHLSSLERIIHEKK